MCPFPIHAWQPRELVTKASTQISSVDFISPILRLLSSDASLLNSPSLSSPTSARLPPFLPSTLSQLRLHNPGCEPSKIGPISVTNHFVPVRNRNASSSTSRNPRSPICPLLANRRHEQFSFLLQTPSGSQRRRCKSFRKTDCIPRVNWR